MWRHAIGVAAVVLTISSQPSAAQQTRAGVLACDVSAGFGLIIGSQKTLSCTFAPDRQGRPEDYDGSITKVGLDLGITGGGVMVWAVFNDTVAGPASVGAGLGANVLVGGSNRTVALQPLSVGGQIGLNLAFGVASLQLGLPRR